MLGAYNGIRSSGFWGGRTLRGFDVIAEAADGKEAYEKILKLKPDILITTSKCREWTE